MTTYLCDICGKSARRANSFTHKKPWLPPQASVDEKAFITLTLHFGFSGHPSGYGGPPDLCEECALRCLDELKAAAEKGMGLSNVQP